MKRVAADPLYRYAYPVTIPTAEETPSDAAGDATRQPAGLTIEELRKLPLPPFPEGVDVTACDDVARIARNGFNKNYCGTDFVPFLRFCTKHACADALVWFLLHLDHILIENTDEPDLDSQQIRYLMTCLERLPEPVTVLLSLNEDWSDQCREAVVDALPKSRRIKGFIDTGHCYSKQEMERLLVAIEDHPVICELGIGLDTDTAAAAGLNHYFEHNSTLRNLSLHCHQGEDTFPAPDITSGLLANRTLTEIDLRGWTITPALVHALAGPDKALTKLSLPDGHLAPGAIAALVTALADNNTLSDLDMDYCRNLSLEDQKALHDGLRRNHSLVSLRIPSMKHQHTHIYSLWKMLKVNLTLCVVKHGMHPPKVPEIDGLLYWSLLPDVKRRLKENREIPFLADQYPMAKLALSLLPGKLPYLPPDISAHIARFLLQTDASALPSYRTLHMLASHRATKAQHRPLFPGHLDLATHPTARHFSKYGADDIFLPPDVLRSMALSCIRHKASKALDWLVVHLSKGALDLRGSQLEPGEAGWLIHWTRAAPCNIKLRLDNVALSKQDLADIAHHLTGNPALTALSLKGCAIAAEDLQLISNALKANMAMVELLLSEHLIVLGWEESERSLSRIPLESGTVVDGNGKVITLPEQASDNGQQALASFREALAMHNRHGDALGSSEQKYFLLAAIAFSLRRNIRLQNGVPTFADLMPDMTFVDDIDLSRHASSTDCIDVAPQ